MNNAFRKDKLNNGCIVQTRDATKYMYLENAYTGDDNQKEDIFIDLKDGSYWELSRYENNLIHRYDKHSDIMKICNMDYVGDNIKKHIINDTDEWTAVREEKEEECLKKIMEEIRIKTEELNSIMARYEEIKND